MNKQLNKQATGITLNGYYQDDFKEKQKIIRELIEVYNFDRDKLDILLDGILIKFCSENKMPNGKYFWYSW